MVYRPSAADAKLVTNTRELVRRSREILSASYPSTFSARREQRGLASGTLVAVSEAKEGAVLIFSCPRTKIAVQHWMDRKAIVWEDEYEAVSCPACGRLHFINRKTLRLLGQGQ